MPDALVDGSPWPRISIVTPSFNQGMFIEEAIRSVLLQGYPNLEYIIIDGGSHDGSVEIIKKYAPWISYWESEKDNGQSHAINKGFEKCTGDIITFFSSDDLYLKGTFGDVGARWDQFQDRGALVGGFRFINSQSQLSKATFPARLPDEGPIDLTITPVDQWRLHQVSMFYTRSALDRVGRFVKEGLHYTMDRELLYRVCRQHKILLASRAYAAFRKHEHSKSISDILPFSREMAHLHLLFSSENETQYETKRRKQLARYQKARGYMKYANARNDIVSPAAALLAALFYMPRLLVRKSYVMRWLNAIHFLPLIKRLGNRQDYLPYGS